MTVNASLCLVWVLLQGALWLLPGVARAADDFSAAEQALFVDNHLASLRPPQTLRYTFSRTGTLEEPFDDSVKLKLTALPDGRCCAASAQFFSGARQLRQPEIEGVQGNPAILYFLERDIREMERLTKGKANYFRKRIRMAVFQSATIRSVTLPYRGRPVAVREISIEPYVDDPNRPRYDRLAGKRYVFMLADGVPGGLYGIRTRIDGESAEAPALLTEAMLIDGAQVSAPLQNKP